MQERPSQFIAPVACLVEETPLPFLLTVKERKEL
jgi:hypothetical protein